MKKLLKKIRKKLSNFYQGLKKWIFWPGRNVLFVILAVIAVIILATVLITLVLGCFGSLLFAILSFLALLLMLGFNWVVPFFGGPEITFKVTLGILVLLIVLLGVIWK